MDNLSPRGRRQGTFITLVFVFAALLTVGAGSAYVFLYERDHGQLVGRELESIAALKAEDLAQWRKERISDGAVLQGNIHFPEAVSRFLRSPRDAKARDRVLAWMRPVRAAHGYDRLFLVDSAGEIRASWPEEGEADPAIATAAPTFLQDGAVGMLDFYRNPADSRIYLSVMVPLGRGPDAGLLAIRIDPELYLYPYIVRWPAESSSAETLLVRKEGDRTLFLNRLRFKADAALNLSFPLGAGSELPAAQAVLGKKGTMLGKDYRGVRVLAALTRVQDSPWFIVSRMDLTEVDAAVRDRRLMMICLVIALLGTETVGVLSLRTRWKLISLRRKAEAAEAVRINEERLRLAITAANQGLYDLNVQTGETVVNDKYASMLGYDPDTFRETNADWIERLHPDDKERASREYSDYVAGHSTEYRVEFRQRTQAGDWKWILSLGKLVERDAEGRPLRMLGTHTDISDRKARENELADLNADLEHRVAERTAQLEASNRELEAFAYSIAHDLRAPLRSIDGFARILQEEFRDSLGEEGLRLLGIIRSSDQKMDTLIVDLLDLTRIGKTDLSPVAVDMRTSALQAFRSCADNALLDGFAFQLGELPPAVADESMMTRVWSNLLSNAVKYSVPAGEHWIEVSGTTQDGMSVYSVRDRGVGFDQRYADKLFGLFQRLHGADQFPGSGIGLSIVKKIVERHGGWVRAEGSPGKGATFQFSLPSRSVS